MVDSDHRLTLDRVCHLFDQAQAQLDKQHEVKAQLLAYHDEVHRHGRKSAAIVEEDAARQAASKDSRNPFKFLESDPPPLSPDAIVADAAMRTLHEHDEVCKTNLIVCEDHITLITQRLKFLTKLAGNPAVPAMAVTAPLVPPIRSMK
jgi:16S rRNA G966 N2-methylase RsmD